MLITGNFEGGNPQNEDSILPLGENAYSIFPFSEDEDPVYKFRLDLKAKRESCEGDEISLNFDWKDEIYGGYRNRLYMKAADQEWVSLEGRAEGSRTAFSLNLPSGETRLTLNPNYDYQDYLNLVTRCADSGDFAMELLHTTEKGRELWMAASRRGDDRLRILITARAHPYETAGSYCIEGFLEGLMEEGAMRRPPKFFALPMLSPDGVCDGFCKLSAKNGEDIARSGNRKDVCVDVLFSLVDKIRPHFILDFHNWMLPDENGLFYEKPRWMRRFASVMAQKGHRDKRWRFGTRRRFFAERPAGMKGYAKQKYGASCMTVEYPWRARTVSDMKRLGANSVATLVELLR